MVLEIFPSLLADEVFVDRGDLVGFMSVTSSKNAVHQFGFQGTRKTALDWKGSRTPTPCYSALGCTRQYLHPDQSIAPATRLS